MGVLWRGGLVFCLTLAWACMPVEREPRQPEQGPFVVSPNDPDTDVPDDSDTEPPVFEPPPLVEPAADPGPWPNEAVVNISAKFRTGAVKSMGVDAAYNLWLLDGRRIGVLRPGASAPTWTSGIGQLAQDQASSSTVVCGGEANRAYVGYMTYSVPHSHYESPSDPEFQKGDVDAVKLGPDGTIALESHLGETTDNSGYKHLGLRNTNDWHYDEDRSVFACARVMKGQFRNEVYLGTNHGVSRIRGLVYNSHRHPVWDVDGSLRIGYNYGVGIAQNGDLLIGNEWKLGILTPPENLADYDDTVKVPYKLNTHGMGISSLEEMDFWRAFQQTTDGKFYVGSETVGVWELTPKSKSSAAFTKVALPSNTVRAMAAAEDGSLFIATASGLYRMDAAKQLSRVTAVPAVNVRELVYDSSVSPPMLWVLAGTSVYVLRGY
jgi:hypothetical protein